jgi:hypothetical protein
MRWTKEEINLSVKMIEEGKSFLDVSKVLGRTQISVTKKLNRLGHKSGYSPSGNYDGGCKYSNYDWVEIQKDYDNGYSYQDLVNLLKLTPHAIKWGQDNNKLKLRSISDGMKLAWVNDKFNRSNKIGIERYRQLCRFTFNVYDYPDYFDLKLIELYGWYRAKNRGDNQNGVSRDHMYSIKEGFVNNIDPYYISHPTNCVLMRHVDNNKKKTNSTITFSELVERVKTFDEKIKTGSVETQE